MRRATVRRTGALARLATLLMLLPTLARADIVGEAVAVAGDTLEVAGRRLRLDGIAVPEIASPEGWMAAAMLRHIVAGHAVRCRETRAGPEGRVLAICHRDDGHDIGELMVRLGHALDCQRDSAGRYAEAEAAALADGRNLAQNFPLPRRCTL